MPPPPPRNSIKIITSSHFNNLPINSPTPIQPANQLGTMSIKNWCLTPASFNILQESRQRCRTDARNSGGGRLEKRGNQFCPRYPRCISRGLTSMGLAP